MPYYSQVKEIEKRDSVLTSTQQIDRLLRPGSTYFNLNPFEVLQIEPEAAVEQIKKRYRQLSILVHPDKNQDDKERAEKAFEIINRAWKILENDLTRKKCLDVYEEAKERTDHMVRSSVNINMFNLYSVFASPFFRLPRNVKRLKKRIALKSYPKMILQNTNMPFMLWS